MTSTADIPVMENLCVAEYDRITVRPLAGSLGAELGGVDGPLDLVDLDDAQLAEIRHAWLRHLVVFFHGQAHLTNDTYLEFARRLGTPIEYPFVRGFEDHPQIIAVVKRPSEVVNFGGIWHSDTTYLPEPPAATMLLARELPPAGGDTMFANQYAAYSSLSAGLQDALDELRAIASSALADVSRTREDRVREANADGADLVLEAAHPIVRTHPETARRALFVNVAHTARIEGWTEEESRPLLDYLFQHQVRPEFTVRFTWQPGSLALWDNRCTQHNPVNDYHGYQRVMHRITLAGDVPRH